jgi:riboflavin kinase/FMN adenylyltransferase
MPAMTAHDPHPAVITRLADARPRPRRLAIGVFDGVHLGHREVMRGADSVLTFDPPPAMVFGRAHGDHVLTTLQQRVELVAELGVRELIVVDFDQGVAALSAEAFIATWLVERLGVRHVDVGENFRFGHRGQGTPEDLRRSTAFTTRVAPTVVHAGAPVSSTRIRTALREGRLRESAALLGRAPELAGSLATDGRRWLFTAGPSAIAPASVPYDARLTLDRGGRGHAVTVVPDADGFEIVTPMPDPPARSVAPTPARLALLDTPDDGTAAEPADGAVRRIVASA